MSTTDRPGRTRTRRSVWLTLLAATVVVLGAAAAVAGTGETDTAAGIATGGLAVVVAALALSLRHARRPDRAGTAQRVLAHQGDERDNRIASASLAITGAVAILVSGLAGAATNLGLSADDVVRWLPFLLLATAAISFVVVDRRS